MDHVILTMSYKINVWAYEWKNLNLVPANDIFCL